MGSPCKLNIGPISTLSDSVESVQSANRVEFATYLAVRLATDSLGSLSEYGTGNPSVKSMTMEGSPTELFGLESGK